MAGKAIAGKVAMSIDPAVRASPGYRTGAVRRQPRRSCVAAGNVPHWRERGGAKPCRRTTACSTIWPGSRPARSAPCSPRAARPRAGSGSSSSASSNRWTSSRARSSTRSRRWRARRGSRTTSWPSAWPNSRPSSGWLQAGAARLNGCRRRRGQVDGEGEAQGNRRKGRRRRQVGDPRAADRDERAPPHGAVLAAEGRPRAGHGRPKGLRAPRYSASPSGHGGNQHNIL